MWRILKSRRNQGHRTAPYPRSPPSLPDRFRGRPAVDPARCADGCSRCVDVCPTDAVRVDDGGLALDLGACLFCNECVAACPTGAIRGTSEHRISARSRDDLVLRGEALPRVQALDEKMLRLFRRSLKLR